MIYLHFRLSRCDNGKNCVEKIESFRVISHCNLICPYDSCHLEPHESQILIFFFSLKNVHISHFWEIFPKVSKSRAGARVNLLLNSHKSRHRRVHDAKTLELGPLPTRSPVAKITVWTEGLLMFLWSKPLIQSYGTTMATTLTQRSRRSHHCACAVGVGFVYGIKMGDAAWAYADFRKIHLLNSNFSLITNVLFLSQTN